MSLYVRVFTNFYSHRKTARLRLVLGNDALWIPPRLWAYAAENQPDGNFDGYKAEEIAMLVGYNGDATSMLQALLDVGFLDESPLRIHDWQVHNSYHENYAERAKKAAAARWKGKEKDKTGKDRKGKETSIASSMLVASEEIYAEYPRKVDKPAALKAIRKAIAAFTAPFILERTKAYAAARIGADPQFTPYPATWFNGQRFNDDPSTWKDTYDKGTHSNRGTGNGRPTPADQRNARIIGADEVRERERRAAADDAAGLTKMPYEPDYVSPRAQRQATARVDQAG